MEELRETRGLLSARLQFSFKNLYVDTLDNSSYLEGLDWSPIEEGRAYWLQGPFTEEEIKKVV